MIKKSELFLTAKDIHGALEDELEEIRTDRRVQNDPTTFLWNNTVQMWIEMIAALN